MPEVRVIVTAVNKMGSTLRDVNRDLEHMQRITKQNAKDYQQLSRMAAGAGIALLGVGVAGGAIIKSSTELAARVETLGTILEGAGASAGYTQKQLYNYEEAVKRSGITTQAARQSMLQMIQANLNLADAQDIARLSQNAAVVAGINSSEAFMRVVTALQRGDIEMLRTMGILVDFQGAYKQAADAADVNVKALDEHTKAQIRLNEVKRASGMISNAYTDAMETAGKQVLSTDRLIEELQLTIGNEFLPTYTEMVEKLYEGLKAWSAQPQAIKSAQVATLGYTTGIAAAGGATLLAGSQVAQGAEALQALGIVGSATLGPLALLAGALYLVGLRAVFEVAKLKAAREELEELEHRLQMTSTGYQNYILLAEAYGDSVGKQTITQEAYNKAIEIGMWGEIEYSHHLVLMTEEVWKQETAMTQARDAVGAWDESLQRAKMATDAARDSLLSMPKEVKIVIHPTPKELWAWGAATERYLQGFINKKRKIYVDMEIRDMGQLFDLKPQTGPSITDPIPPTSTESAKTELEASGGQLGKGWTLVGDPGPQEELISPSGWVFDAQTTKQLLRSGLVPGIKRGLGGAIGAYEGDVVDFAYSAGAPGFSWGPDDTTFGPPGGGQVDIGGGDVAEVATQTATQVAETVGAAVEAVPGAVAVVVSAQMAAQTAQAEQQLRIEAKQLTQLTAILERLIELADADEITESMISGLQKADI